MSPFVAVAPGAPGGEISPGSSPDVTARLHAFREGSLVVSKRALNAESLVHDSFATDVLFGSISPFREV